MAAPATKATAAEALLATRPAPAPAAAWAEARRRDARARFLGLGAPGRRDEYWKYTDPTPLTEPGPVSADLTPPDETPIFDGVDAARIVFVDGVYDAALSSPAELAGVEIQPLAEALAADIHWARELYGKLEEAGQTPVARPLAALNTAMAETGMAIRVTGAAARPVRFLYLRRAAESDAMMRHLIKVEAGASLTVLESGPAAARFNKVMEVELGDGAAFHHIRTQGRDHQRRAATHIFARLGAEALFKSFTLTANGALTRNECVIEFAGADAAGHVAGACIGDGAFLHDDTIFVTHAAERCESRQVFKKVLRNGARGVFQGKILVRPGAQKTDGYQISQALLLDEDSEFNAKPELEIYADDVACSHGSTCGAIDETALFYLRSRGVPLVDAQSMMVLAFIDEAVAEIENEEVGDQIRHKVAEWLERRARR